MIPGRACVGSLARAMRVLSEWAATGHVAQHLYERARMHPQAMGAPRLPRHRARTLSCTAHAAKQPGEAQAVHMSDASYAAVPSARAV